MGIEATAKVLQARQRESRSYKSCRVKLAKRDLRGEDIT